MKIFHTVDNDPPTRSDRQLEQDRIDKAVADFLATGRQIEAVTVAKQHSKVADSLSDDELVKQLVLFSSEAKTLQESAKALKVAEARCRALAVKHRIPFRSKSFLKKRAAR